VICYLGTEFRHIDDTLLRIELNREAAEKGFRVVDMPADGNCGLHAVVDQLSAHGVVVEAAFLRKQAVSYLKEHPQVMDHEFMIRSEYPTRDCYLNLNKQSVNGC